MPDSPSHHGVTPTDECDRLLILVPIIHTPSDMGSLGPAISEIGLKEIGAGNLEKSAKKIDEIWTEIEETIYGMALDFHKVRLYQDGLPVCGQELKIVSDLAKNGSRNHRLLLDLMSKGSTLMGTESAALLMEEYKLIVNSLEPNGVEERKQKSLNSDTRFNELLEKRDQAIASRINETLLAGETGLLFLGMLHSVENWLVKDILVRRPFVFHSDLTTNTNG